MNIKSTGAARAASHGSAASGQQKTWGIPPVFTHPMAAQEVPMRKLRQNNIWFS